MIGERLTRLVTCLSVMEFSLDRPREFCTGPEAGIIGCE